MSAALWLLAGLLGGGAHFLLLRWNTRLYLQAGALTHALPLQLLRLAVTSLLLTFAALHGVLPLVLSTLGIMLARLLVVRLTEPVP